MIPQSAGKANVNNPKIFRRWTLFFDIVVTWPPDGRVKIDKVFGTEELMAASRIA